MTHKTLSLSSGSTSEQVEVRKSVKCLRHLKTTHKEFDIANVCILFTHKANIEEFMDLEIKLPETTDEVKMFSHCIVFRTHR